MKMSETIENLKNNGEKNIEWNRQGMNTVERDLKEQWNIANTQKQIRKKYLKLSEKEVKNTSLQKINLCNRNV